MFNYRTGKKKNYCSYNLYRFEIFTGPSPPTPPSDHGFGDFSRCPKGITSTVTCK